MPTVLFGGSSIDWIGLKWGSKDLGGILDTFPRGDSENLPSVDYFKEYRTYTMGGNTYHSSTILKNYPFGDPKNPTFMDAYFLKDKQSRLAAIKLELSSWMGGGAVIQRLQDYLQAEYGKPVEEFKRADATLGITQDIFRWRSKGIDVFLCRLKIPSEGVDTVIVTYMPMNLSDGAGVR